MSTFNDPNREAVGLEPIWTGAPGEPEPVEPPVEPPEEPEVEPEPEVVEPEPVVPGEGYSKS